MPNNLVTSAMDCLDALSETSSSNAKKAILEENAANHVLKSLLYCTYNPYWTYGVNSVSIPATKAVILSDSVLNYSVFRGLCASLRERELTGLTAKQALFSFFSGCTIQETKVYRGVLCKDLEIGMGSKLINAVIPALIPVYDVMLASPFDEHKLEYPVYAEPKLDGVRCLCAVDNTVTLLTRNGHGLSNFPVIATAISDLFPSGTVVDGELVSPQGFQSTMKQVFRKDKVISEGFEYHIFDTLLVTEFEGKTQTPYVSRLQRRQGYKKKNTSPVLHFVPTKFCENFSEVKEVYDFAIGQGYEGLVLKNPEAPYVQKRSVAWMKVKSDSFGGCVDVDLRVIGYEGGEGALKGKLGALVCVYKGKEVKVGTGLTLKDRTSLQGKLDAKEAVIIRVIAQEETEAGSLRFPRYAGERNDLVRKN